MPPTSDTVRYLLGPGHDLTVDVYGDDGTQLRIAAGSTPHQTATATSTRLVLRDAVARVLED